MQKFLFWLGSPPVALLIPSTYVGSCFLLGIVNLSLPLVEPGSVVYFVSGIVCMVAISCVIIFRSIKKGRFHSNEKIFTHKWKHLWTPFLLLASLVGFFVVVDYTVSIGYTIGYADLVALRQEFYRREPTLMGYLANAFTPFSLMLLGVTIISFEELSSIKRVLGLMIGSTIPIVLALGLGGRASIVDWLILSVWWLLQRSAFGKPLFPRYKISFIPFVLATIGAILLINLVSIARSPQGAMQFKNAIFFNQNAVSVSVAVSSFMDEIDPRLATSLSEALFYWSTPVAAFDKLYEHWSLDANYIMAISPVLCRRVASIGLCSLDEVRNMAASILWSYGMWPNIFYTAPFHLIVSFGKVGAFIAQIILAIVSSHIYVKARRKREFWLMYLASLFYLMFFYWFQTILTAYPLHEYGFYWCAAFLLLRILSKQKSSLYNGAQLTS